MNTTPITSRTRGIALTAVLGLGLSASPARGQDPCSASALETLRSCRAGAFSELLLQRAKCTNLPTLEERIACNRDAVRAFWDAIGECQDQHDARGEVCDRLGGGIYHPPIDPHDFAPVIDNPYLPLLPGTTLVYEKETEEGTERTLVRVTDETKEILGVTCTEVQDVETLDGELIEHTFDWFAQDVQGTVWYFGELSMAFEDGELVSLGGSWRAGVDGAQPGVIMEASPQVGDFYRQEFLIQEAEDVAGVLSLSERVRVPYGSFRDCLQTEDFSPLEPGNVEHKYYAPGVGLVLEVDPQSGERSELVAIAVDDDDDD